VTSTHPDLEALRREDVQGSPKRRRRGARLFGALLGLGFLAAVYAVAQPFLFPPRIVRIGTIRLVDGSVPVVRAGSTIEDVGWLEAYPFPITVRPLVTGVLDRLEVLEGQAVKKGETVIGVLRNLGLERARDVAQAEVDMRAADVRRAVAVLAVAESLLEQKLDLRAEREDVDGQLHTARAEVARLHVQHETSLSAQKTAQVDVDAQRRVEAAGGAMPVALARALSRFEETRHRAEDVLAAIERAKADVVRLERMLAVAIEGIQDPRRLQGDVDVAAADLDQAKAVLSHANVVLAAKQSFVDALVVRAPIDGVVMRLDSAPGAAVGPAGMFRAGDESGPGSTSRLNRMTGRLVTLYDPTALQLRVDVLYGQLTHVRVGVKVTFAMDGLPGRRFDGVVDRLVHEADINQNALQAKIRVNNPDPAMRPEMLCRVRFEEPADTSDVAPSAGAGPRRVLVPSEAVRDGAVFVFDPTGGGRARRIPVSVLGTEGDMTAIEGPLGLSSKLILDPVEDGERVRTTS